jgi:hypothetical protein
MLMDAGQDGAAYHEIIARSIDFFKTDTVKLMKLLGCSGAA